MDRKFGLSPSEYEIMEFLWSADHKLYFKEILEYFNNVKNKGWKKQTVSSFLKILQDNGHVCSDKNGKKYLYYSALPNRSISPAGCRNCVKIPLEILWAIF